MELTQIPSFLMLFISLFFSFLVLRILRKKKVNKKLPPGPWKLPLIGSIHHLITTLPHRRLADLAKVYGPIMHLQLGELTNIVVSAPETAKEVMKTHDISFADRPRLVGMALCTYNYTDIGLAPYGDYWRQMKKICIVELLTAKRVESFKSIREEQVSKLIRLVSSSADGRTPINFSRMIGSLTYSIVSRTAFGRVWEGEEVFVAAIKEFIRVSGGFSLADLYPSVKLLKSLSRLNSKVERHQRKTDKILHDIIDEHRARKAAGIKSSEENKDLVDVLLNVQEQGELQFPLKDDNIKAILLDIFGGGTETSSTTIEWAMSELLKNPRIMKKAQLEVRQVFGTEGNIDESRLSELSYLKMVIKETLRLHPPLALLLPRECREKCSIYGYEIPVKSKVVVNVWAMGRDPKYWNEAEKFNPERFIKNSVDYKGMNFEYLPFGSGRRMGPGIAYGMANVEFPLAQLLYHFNWKLPGGTTPENIDMIENCGAVVKRKNELHLIPIPYYHPSAI
uniref:Cytochrome P450 CYP71-4 n=1 Tax=Euphorbia poissonii TaxID=212962 RepID=A0A977Q624_9ROSI|nr:cytochrome P450 CYP71-4 [Euphorbia poissonii]